MATEVKIKKTRIKKPREPREPLRQVNLQFNHDGEKKEKAVYLPLKLYDELKKIADKEGRKFHGLIIHWLCERFDCYKDHLFGEMQDDFNYGGNKSWNKYLLEIIKRERIKWNSK